MRRERCIRFWTILLAGLALPAVAFGATLTVEFKATIVSVSASICQCIPGGTFSIGDTLVGEYTIDPLETDSDPDPTMGLYLMNVPPHGISVHHSNYSFESDPSTVDLRVGIRDAFTDQYLLTSYSNLADPFWGGTLQSISFELFDLSGTVLTSDSLSDSAPVLNDWPVGPGNRVVTIKGNGFGWTITGDLIWIQQKGPVSDVGGRVPPAVTTNVWPNPFSDHISLSFVSLAPSPATVDIYDVKGRHVARVMPSAWIPSGETTVEWDGLDDSGRRVASGTYFARVAVGTNVTIMKITRLK